jgi:hypothetical protein
LWWRTPASRPASPSRLPGEPGKAKRVVSRGDFAMTHQTSGVIAAGPPEPAHPPLATPPTELPGLDGWETDGGACATGGGCRPDPDPERDR